MIADRRFGVSRIVEILRGSRSKALLACGVERCPTYGSARTRSKDAMTRLIKDLIKAGYLQVEGLEYPTLNVTSIGQEVLRGDREISLAKQEGRSSQSLLTTHSVHRPVPPVVPKTSVPDHQLYDRLRRLRTELAEEEGVAPFVIFQDKTLRTIASQKPATPEGLLEIPGIGEIKVERYGRRVLEIVNGE